MGTNAKSPASITAQNPLSFNDAADVVMDNGAIVHVESLGYQGCKVSVSESKSDDWLSLVCKLLGHQKGFSIKFEIQVAFAKDSPHSVAVVMDDKCCPRCNWSGAFSGTINSKYEWIPT